MGWAHGTLPYGREVGYAVVSTCEHPGCGTAIDRGLFYLCGEMHGQDDDACGHYFCAEHLYHTGAGQRCQPCADAPTDHQGHATDGHDT